MRRAELSKGSDHWLVTVMDDGVPVSWGWYDVPTHAEAMFLAQLLADPHEYIRAAQERAWEAGFDGGEKDAFSHQTFNEPCIPNPYRKDQS